MNVTLTIQFPFDASGLALVHPLLDIAKSPGSVPLITMLLMVKDEEPPLVRVTL